MKILFLSSLSFLAQGKRLLFWLAIVQQKEYRLDRIKLYFASEEGKKEIWNLLPHRSWTAIKFWKRPSWTARVFVLVVGWLLLSGAILGSCIWLSQYFVFASVLMTGLTIAIVIILIYIITPWLVLVGLLPTVVVAIATTAWISRRAHALVQHHHPLVIGITGSYGKTSTKQLLAHVLAAKYSVFATPNSFNTRYSVAKSIVDGYKGEEVLIVEYGAYKKGEIAKLCQSIAPKLAVITGITTQHLGIFGDIESIIAAKSELTQALPANGVVFYNGGDHQTKKVIAAFDGLQYAYNQSSDHQVQSAGLTARGHLELVLDGVIVKTQFVGLHYLSCIEAALTVGEYLGVPRSQIIARLMSFAPTTNFTRINELGHERRLLDDGQTSNPVGYRAMCDLASVLPGRPKILVFGGIVDLGDQTQSIHQELAQISTTVFDQVWYLTPVGQAEFTQVKKDWLMSDKTQILPAVKNLPAGCLLVIEGKIPAWLSHELNQLMRTI